MRVLQNADEPYGFVIQGFPKTHWFKIWIKYNTFYICNNKFGSVCLFDIIRLFYSLFLSLIDIY
jgi:hypothetical protein